MVNPYQDSQAALKYLDFLNSPNGQIQQRVLYSAVRAVLPNSPDLKILDAGCGSGWLAGMLKNYFKSVEACDSSDFLIRFAKTHGRGADFKVAELDKPLPYRQNYFDVVLLNMVGPDLANLNSALANISAALKPSGKLLMTIPNPEFTYPAAEWKRGIAGFIFRRKPKLILKTPPAGGEKIFREFGKKSKIHSYYYPLDSYLTGAKNAGLDFLLKQAVMPEGKSRKFDLNYQLARYSLLLLLEFKKTV